MCDIILHAPWPSKGDLRRSLQALDLEHDCTLKHRRLQSLVRNWLANVVAVPPRTRSATAVNSKGHQTPVTYCRASSVPASFDRDQLLWASTDYISSHQSSVDEMPGPDRKHQSAASDRSASRPTNTSFAKIKPSSAAYQEVLEYNNVFIDRTGSKMSADIGDFVTTEILKRRSSPPLAQEKLDQTIQDIEKWGNTTESVLNNFASTPMWPVYDTRLRVGGNSPWARKALPFNPSYGHPISTPVPDRAVGYACGRESGLSDKEMQVASNPYVRSHIQPATGLLMPFLVAEVKSNVTGGTT